MFLIWLYTYNLFRRLHPRFFSFKDILIIIERNSIIQFTLIITKRILNNKKKGQSELDDKIFYTFA